MPKIYSNEKRLEIKEQLLDAGLELIRQFGLSRLRIEDVTKRAGIAQGTFYNFYPSKEMLVYALAERYQSRLNDRIQSVVNTKGFLDREDLQQVYLEMMLRDTDNVYRYITRPDMQVLLTRLPKECFLKLTDIRNQIELNLSLISNKKNSVDIGAVINWIQMMNLAVQNHDLLVASGLEKVIHTLVGNMLDEIFEKS